MIAAPHQVQRSINNICWRHCACQRPHQGCGSVSALSWCDVRTSTAAQARKQERTLESTANTTGACSSARVATTRGAFLRTALCAWRRRSCAAAYPARLEGLNAVAAWSAMIADVLRLVCAEHARPCNGTWMSCSTRSLCKP